MSHAATLRKALAGKSLILAPGAYDCITARLIEQAGFTTVYMTGSSAAASHLGVPDYGLPTMTEMADMAGRIANSLSVPLIADADTGFGNELNVIRTVREYEQRGVAALHIEDQVFPKRCGHFEGKDVESREDFIAKMRAAAAGRRNKDTVIIARTDSLAVAGFDEAVLRMNLALDAGADVAFLEATTSKEQMAQVPKLVKGPCLITQTTRGTKTPRVEVSELEEMGYRIVLFPGMLSRHIAITCDEILRELHDTRSWPKNAREPQNQMEFPRKMGMEMYDKWRTAFRDPLPIEEVKRKTARP